MINNIGKVGIIYKAINKLNNKGYIGQTIIGLKRRVALHYIDSERRDYAFSRALRKYKKDNWKWIVLYDNVPIGRLNVTEVFAISAHNTYCCGYNSTIGGEDNPTKYKEVREKISRVNKGRFHSNKTKIKMSNKALKRKRNSKGQFIKKIRCYK